MRGLMFEYDHLNRLAGFAMRSAVLHKLPPQIGGGGEDPARDHVALDLRKPEFDLVQPRAIGRHVVDGHPAVQRLNVGFLIHGKDDGIRRRRLTKSDDIRRVRLEIGVVARDVALDAMRLEPGALPHAMHDAMTDRAERLRHAPLV